MRKPRVTLTQILPSFRFMPTLPIEKELAEELIGIVERAMARAGKAITLAEHMLAPKKARQAAEFYVSTKENETSLPEFRRIIGRNKKDSKKGSIAAAAADLLELLKDGTQPPFAQMQTLFCSSEPAAIAF